MRDDVEIPNVGESVEDSEGQCPVCGCEDRGITDDVLFICTNCGTRYREVNYCDEEGNKTEYLESQVIEKGDVEDD